MDEQLTVEVTFPDKEIRRVPAEKVAKLIAPGFMSYVDTPIHMNGYEFHQLVNRSWIAVEVLRD